jgi:transcriptional regulator with XRE-family HTH domain
MTKKISERLADLIGYMRVSQNEFAKRVGISTTLISYWITGRNKPSLLKINQVIDKLKDANIYVNADWLIHGQGEMLTEPTVSRKMNELLLLEKEVKDIEDHNQKAKEEMRFLQRIIDQQQRHIELLEKELKEKEEKLRLKEGK